MCIYINLPKNNRVHTPIFLGSSNFIHYDLMVGLKQEFRLKQTEATSTMKSHRLTSLYVYMFVYVCIMYHAVFIK